ncbi:MAG: glycan-binding surface protein [Bacteroides sp.]|nr:glycan-binding surface protein [Bacteroides sp.]
MKSIFPYKNLHVLSLIVGVVIAALGLTACSDDDSSGSKSPIKITGVCLEDATSSVPDRLVDFIRIGQVIRVEGSGFTGLKRLYVNGYNTYFNPAYVSDGSMLFAVAKATPIVEAEPEDRNTIRLAKDGSEATYSIEVRAASPTLTQVLNTLPKVGEPVTVYGEGLVEIESVTFPGNVVITDGIVSDKDGEYFTVAMPAGVSEEGGSLFAIGANGGGYSPAYFNFKKGVILDFDGMGGHGFWQAEGSVSMIMDEDLESALVGKGNTSQGNYVNHLPARLKPAEKGKTRISEIWTAGSGVDDWRGQLTPYIPTNTPVNQVAFQFDIYVPEAWTSGYLKICLINSFSGCEWSGATYNYIPWLVDGEIVPFQTEGWQTVTIPFSYFYAFSDPEGEFTFEDVLETRENATYENFEIYFENTNFTLANVTGNSADSEVEFDTSEVSIDIYSDNWRVVSLETPSYSDFPDNDEDDEE